MDFWLILTLIFVKISGKGWILLNRQKKDQINQILKTSLIILIQNNMNKIKKTNKMILKIEEKKDYKEF